MKKITLLLWVILTFASVAIICGCGGEKEPENSSVSSSWGQGIGGSGIELPEDKFD